MIPITIITIQIQFPTPIKRLLAIEEIKFNLIHLQFQFVVVVVPVQEFFVGDLKIVTTWLGSIPLPGLSSLSWMLCGQYLFFYLSPWHVQCNKYERNINANVSFQQVDI